MYPTGSLFLNLGSESHISVITRLCIRPSLGDKGETIFIPPSPLPPPETPVSLAFLSQINLCQDCKDPGELRPFPTSVSTGTPSSRVRIVVAKPRNVIRVYIEISAIVIHPLRTVDDALLRRSVHGRSISEISIETFTIFLGYVTTIFTRKVGVPVEFHVLGPVGRTPVSANPGLNFNPGFVFFLSKALPRIIFSILFGVSNHQILGKKNSSKFLLKFSYLRSNFALTLGYPNPASNNPALNYFHLER